ncbi:MAG: 3-deoxy-8-phosphooctulonate synthase [Albidovulum sp.]|nr:3-deoxy-8-phosphooctulonate synthase [Albidovulum sp.]MDE0530241.1 3-deoxy-8-phosphooctulonate synthase [Albidovulum sp.]
MNCIIVGNTNIGNDLPLSLIAGPCQIESLGHAEHIAGYLTELASRLGMGFIFKASFDKANRTSLDSARGPGMKDGLKVLSEVRKSVGCPVLTDVHDAGQCGETASVADALQVPAFLCRQTDLLVAVGTAGKPVNLKKGQFLAPWDMVHAVAKVESTGNRNIMLCERGTCFGYNSLVVDIRSIPVMKKTGYPVVIDATHSVQIPGGHGTSSGGQREFAPVIARAAVSIGVAAVFIETHEDPARAPSDGPNMVPLGSMPGLIESLREFDLVAKAHPLDGLSEAHSEDDGL